jgi:hypothetical protein
MSNPAELSLVRKANESGLGGCIEWEAKVTDRVAADLAGYGLTILHVRAMNWVKSRFHGGAAIAVKRRFMKRPLITLLLAFTMALNAR